MNAFPQTYQQHKAEQRKKKRYFWVIEEGSFSVRRGGPTGHILAFLGYPPTDAHMPFGISVYAKSGKFSGCLGEERTQ